MFSQFWMGNSKISFAFLSQTNVMTEVFLECEKPGWNITGSCLCFQKDKFYKRSEVPFSCLSWEPVLVFRSSWSSKNLQVLLHKRLQKRNVPPLLPCVHA